MASQYGSQRQYLQHKGMYLHQFARLSRFVEVGYLMRSDLCLENHTGV
jgi:hypothetical protein